MNARALLAALLATSIALGAEGPPSPMTAATPSVPLAPLPAGWSSMNGNGGPQALPGTCEIGVDSQASAAGQLYSVRCTNTFVPSYGGARSTIQTARYRGKRVRVSAWLMTSAIEGVASPQYSGVPGEAGLWIGVGSPRNGIRMDRMQDRTIKGSTSWEQRDFVVDIPEDNNQVMVGFWMQGKGQVWMRDLKLEEVPNTVPLNVSPKDPRPAGPDLSLQ